MLGFIFSGCFQCGNCGSWGVGEKKKFVIFHSAPLRISNGIALIDYCTKEIIFSFLPFSKEDTRVIRVYATDICGILSMPQAAEYTEHAANMQNLWHTQVCRKYLWHT